MKFRLSAETVLMLLFDYMYLPLNISTLPLQRCLSAMSVHRDRCLQHTLSVQRENCSCFPLLLPNPRPSCGTSESLDHSHTHPPDRNRSDLFRLVPFWCEVQEFFESNGSNPASTESRLERTRPGLLQTKRRKIPVNQSIGTWNNVRRRRQHIRLSRQRVIQQRL